MQRGKFGSSPNVSSVGEDMIFTDRYGHRRRGKTYTCLYCRSEFVERLIPAQKTQPKYCSRDCCYKHRQRRVDVTCDNCGKQFRRVVNKLKNSVHGKTFCSRRCKDHAQSFRGNCSDIHPPHYDKDNPTDYRTIAYAFYPHRCVDCGVSKDYVLVVHHIDGNRKNNHLYNLEIVCHNHHTLRHLKKTGEVWRYCSSTLTPREKLKALLLEVG